MGIENFSGVGAPLALLLLLGWPKTLRGWLKFERVADGENTKSKVS